MKYGCHNRAPFRAMFPAQDGWWMDGVTRTAKMVPQAFRMTAECQYTKTELGRADERCTGCKWKQQ